MSSIVSSDGSLLNSSGSFVTDSDDAACCCGDPQDPRCLIKILPCLCYREEEARYVSKAQAILLWPNHPFSSISIDNRCYQFLSEALYEDAPPELILDLEGSTEYESCAVSPCSDQLPCPPCTGGFGVFAPGYSDSCNEPFPTQVCVARYVGFKSGYGKTELRNVSDDELLASHLVYWNQTTTIEIGEDGRGVTTYQSNGFYRRGGSQAGDLFINGSWDVPINTNDSASWSSQTAGTGFIAPGFGGVGASIGAPFVCGGPTSYNTSTGATSSSGSLNLQSSLSNSSITVQRTSRDSTLKSEGTITNTFSRSYSYAGEPVIATPPVYEQCLDPRIARACNPEATPQEVTFDAAVAPEGTRSIFNPDNEELYRITSDVGLREDLPLFSYWSPAPCDDEPEPDDNIYWLHGCFNDQRVGDTKVLVGEEVQSRTVGCRVGAGLVAGEGYAVVVEQGITGCLRTKAVRPSLEVMDFEPEVILESKIGECKGKPSANVDPRPGCRPSDVGDPTGIDDGPRAQENPAPDSTGAGLGDAAEKAIKLLSGGRLKTCSACEERKKKLNHLGRSIRGRIKR